MVSHGARTRGTQGGNVELIDVFAVVGSCGPERGIAARRLAEETGAMLVPAPRLAMAPDPVDEAAALVPWAYRERRAVVEPPAFISMTDLIGTFVDEDRSTRLVGITCVVDAGHIIDDLRRDDYFVRRTPAGEEGCSRALIAAEQIEFASTVLLVNWQPLSTPNLSAVMAVVSHLSPHAVLQLDRSGSARPVEPTVYTAGQERPGWVGILNDDYHPHITDPRVSAFRYEQLRLMHPERLSRLLDQRIARGEFGTVLRSAGFCRLASRPHLTANWEHVGQMFSLHPLQADGGDVAGDGEPGGSEMLGLGQDIAFIGLDLDRERLTAALDAAALTDAEFAAGPTLWASFADPFPVPRTSMR